jgi:hypothetical protein
LRGDESVELKLSVGEKEQVEKHVFAVNENATPEQVALRETWMKNLD